MRPNRDEVIKQGAAQFAEAVRSADKEVAAFSLSRGQYSLKTLGHRLREPLVFLMIGAGACTRLAGFGFPTADDAPAFACWSRSRTITRIHSGSADRPLRKSS